MNLSHINECIAEASDAVYEMLDDIHLKQLMILEYANDADISKYRCFQEGFLFSGSKKLDIFKFENKHILNAIKYFNEAYNSIPFDEYPDFIKFKTEQERGKLDWQKDVDKDFDPTPNALINEVKKLISDSDTPFKNAFDELEEQFNCKFDISCINRAGIGTIPKCIFAKDEIRGNLSISKKKGFQLGGMHIKLNISAEQLLYLAPANTKLFGQSFTAIILHEIYHNIVRTVEVRNTDLYKNINTTFKDVKKMDNKPGIMSKLTSFVNKFMQMFNIKTRDIDKDKALTRLYILSQIQNDSKAMEQFQKDIENNSDPDTDEEINEYIDDLTSSANSYKIARKRKIVQIACVVLITALGFAVDGAVTTITATVSATYLALLSLKMILIKVFKFLHGGSERLQEEYFCDLFAAMYKLPVHLESFNRQIELNKVNPKGASKMRDADLYFGKSAKDPHPTTFNRELTSYRLAKQMLSSHIKLKKDIREYLEYIVELHEGIEDIDNPYDKKEAKKLDPQAAADLRKTMKEFIEKTGVTVTESYIDELCNMMDGEYYVFG